MSDKNKWDNDNPTEFIGDVPDDLGDPGIKDNDFDLDKDFTLDDDPIDSEPLNLDSDPDEPTEVIDLDEPTEVMEDNQETEIVDNPYESNPNEAWSESRMEWGMPSSIDSTPTHQMEPIDDFLEEEPDLLEQNEELSATIQDLRTDNKELEKQVKGLQDDNFTLSNDLEDNINSRNLNKILYGVIAALVILVLGVSWWGATNSGEASRIAGENAIGQRENMTKDEQISSLDAQLDNERKKLEALQEESRSKDREINDLRGQMSSKDGEINDAIAARDAANKRADEASSRIGDLEKRLREAESKPARTETTTATTTVTESSVSQSPPVTVTKTVEVPAPGGTGGTGGEADAG